MAVKKKCVRLLSLEELKTLKGIPLTHARIWAMIRAGMFPLPVKMEGGRSAFSEAEVDEWIEARLRARNHGVNMFRRPVQVSA
jgi:prophage regulatory protein